MKRLRTPSEHRQYVRDRSALMRDLAWAKTEAQAYRHVADGLADWAKEERQHGEEERAASLEGAADEWLLDAEALEEALKP